MKKRALDPKFDEAIRFIAEKHGTQVRAFSMSPYYTHPVAVACLVMKFKKSKNIDELVLSALCHDLLEDTETTFEEIQSRYGTLVASLVEELTSDPEGIKLQGKTAYLASKLPTLTSYALNIKLCDRLHNCMDFIFAPAHSWKSMVQRPRQSFRLSKPGS